MQIITNRFQKELKQHGSGGFPFLVSRERLSRYEAGSFMWHWHPEIEITLVQRGRMLYRVNDRTFHLKEGEALFGNSNVLHTGAMEKMQDCEYISITFDPRLIYGFFQSTIHTRYVEPALQNFSRPAICIDGREGWHREFTGLIREIMGMDQERPPFYEMEIVIGLQRLWKLMLENGALDGGGPALNEGEYRRVREIILFVEKNYMNQFALKDVAAQIHLCESECCRLFKRYMKVTLFSFLQEYRIERSMEYLARGEPVGEIAGKVGFSDSNYYSKVFARVKGCSPRKYRERSLIPSPAGAKPPPSHKRAGRTP